MTSVALAADVGLVTRALGGGADDGPAVVDAFEAFDTALRLAGFREALARLATTSRWGRWQVRRLEDDLADLRRHGVLAALSPVVPPDPARVVVGGWPNGPGPRSDSYGWRPTSAIPRPTASPWPRWPSGPSRTWWHQGGRSLGRSDGPPTRVNTVGGLLGSSQPVGFGRGWLYRGVRTVSSAQGSASPGDRVLPPTRILSIAIIPFLLVAFVVLYFYPSAKDTARLFAWRIVPPFTPMVLGSVYLGGSYFFLRASRATEWHRVEGGFLSVGLFATLMGIATIVHWNKFIHSNVAFWLWAGLYFTTPFLVFGVFFLNRREESKTTAE